MTRVEFCKLLAVLDVNFNRKPLSEEHLEIWHRLLGDLDYTIAERAVQKIILTSRYYPTVADIRTAYFEITTGPKITGLEAWGIFAQYISIYSTGEDYEKLKADYPDIYQIVHSVGARELLSGDPSFVRPEFERIYGEFKKIQSDQALLPEGFLDDTRKLRENIYKQLKSGDEESYE